MEVFSIVGKIAVKFSDALSKIDKVSNAADDAADSLNDVSDAAEDSQKPIKGSGDAAADADNKFSVWQMTLANLAANAIQGIIHKVGELAAKLGEFAANSVKNFATFEQLVGGTELMFGKAADFVMRKSEQAYKTVQMSQNDYLQQVNGFATGLKTALGGNEQAAAELAHKIITAEADIVAATGNSQEAVQNAFNGIMKSNYTMLDNLQLGITPTKEGFQEVIDKVNEWNATQGRVTNYTIENLADCQAALVDYVEMQGLAGYASNEAGSTIQGSWSSVLALFENIKTKVGSQLAPVVMGFLQQLSTWIETVDWDAFTAKLGESFGKLTEWISSIDFTTFFEAGINGVASFVEGLGELIDKVVSALEGFNNFLDILTTLAPAIAGGTAALVAFKAAMSITSIINGVVGAFKAFQAANEGATVAQWLLNAAMSANPIILIVTLIAGLIAAIIALWNTNEDFRNGVIAAWEAVKNAFVTLGEIIKNVWNSISSTISTAIENIKITITEKFTAAKEVISNIFNAVKDFVTTIFSAIWSIISNKLESIKTAFSTYLSAVSLIVQSIFNSIVGIITSVTTAIWSVVSDKLENVKTAFSTKLQAALSTVTSIFESIRAKISEKIEAAKEIVRSGVEALKSFFNFEWNLPHIKLPHFSITGSFSLNPPSAPHFGVEWYKHGAILTNPSIFGFNPYTGKAMGGGEAGNEAIAPIDTLQKYVRSAVAEENNMMLEILSAILKIVSSIDDNMADNLYHALLGLQFKINDREFARLVKAVS